MYARTDRLGHRLRGEPEPARPEPPETAYPWLRHSTLSEVATVTLVTGSDVRTCCAPSARTHLSVPYAPAASWWRALIAGTARSRPRGPAGRISESRAARPISVIEEVPRLLLEAGQPRLASGHRLSVLDDGTLLDVYTLVQLRDGARELSVQAVRSGDGGVTWSRPRKVADLRTKWFFQDPETGDQVSHTTSLLSDTGAADCVALVSQAVTCCVSASETEY